jgi:hypothetical protein
MMSTRVLETCRDLEQTYNEKELCVKLVIYNNYTEMLYGQQNIKFDHVCREWNSNSSLTQPAAC